VEGDVSPVAQQELESRLWDAANSLRAIAPSERKNYILPALFWKWISDTWFCEHEEVADDFGDDLSADVKNDYQRFIVPDGCLWPDVTNDTTANLGYRIRTERAL
jgi:type I restriction enzyme M protein